MRRHTSLRSKLLVLGTILICLVSLPAFANSFFCKAFFTSLPHRIVQPLKNKSIDQLLEEQKNAKSTYQSSTNQLIATNDLREINRLIRIASRGQVTYCKLHNQIVKRVGGYKLIPLDIFYIGERLAKSRSDQKISSVVPPVYYYSPSELRKAHVNFAEGYIYHDNGTQLRGELGREYIMTKDGEIYILPSYNQPENYRFRHSSLANGEPVAAAGKISIGIDGKIDYISRQSGHYNPGKLYLEQFIHRLKLHGVDLRNTKIQWNISH